MTTTLPPTISDGSVTLTFGPAGVYYGYCTIADVLFEFTNKDNMPKALSDSAIAQEITYTATNSLQPTLNLFYEMPYAGSDPTILSTLREMNVKYAVVQLIDRYMTANEATSVVAAASMNRVAGIFADIEHGVIRWDTPFGDAIPRADLPVYPHAALYTLASSSHRHSSTRASRPLYGMGRMRFRDREAL